jgi:hypothetical protein
VNTYKITFVNNTILTLNKVDGIYFFEGEKYYYLNGEGFLVYALVRAATKENAEKMAIEIIRSVI